MSQEKPAALIVWAFPRTRSTMLERCFISHPSIVAFHEPCGQATFLGPEHTHTRLDAQHAAGMYAEKYAHASFDGCWQRIVNPPPGKTSFVKDLARNVFLPPKDCLADTAKRLPEEANGNPTLFRMKDWCDPRVVHVFLIRDLRATITSQYRISLRDEGFEIDNADVGIDTCRRLYDLLCQNLSRPPTVIDSDDVIAHPEAVLRLLCAEAGIEYRQEMLDWDDRSAAKAKELFSCWSHWHIDALESTTVQKKEKSEAAGGVMPETVSNLVEENLPDYEYLKSKVHKFAI